MRQKFISAFFVSCLTLCLTTICDANTPKRPKAIKLDSVYVHSSLSQPQVGDSIYLCFKYTPAYTGVAKLTLHFPGVVVPTNRTANETWRELPMLVDSGQSKVDSIALSLIDSGNSMISLAFVGDSMVASSRSLSRSDNDFVEISQSNTFFAVAYTYSRTSVHRAANSMSDFPAGVNLVYLQGKVLFKDPSSGLELGVSKVRVGLLPVEPGPISQDQWGNLKAISSGFWKETAVDMDGSFTITQNNIDLSNVTHLLLVVEPINDAAALVSPSSSIVDFFAGSVLMRQAAIFPAPSQGLDLVKTAGGSFIQGGLKVFINPQDGSILRNMQISQEYDHCMTNHTPDRITVYNEYPGSGYAGLFTLAYHFLAPNTVKIQIDPRYTESATCDHEWGHWFNCYVWDLDYSPFSESSHTMREGFAEFHQFAVRNYASAFYGDPVEWRDDNQEEAPFNPTRFWGIRYFGYPAAAFSSFLWNVYDEVSDFGYKANQYVGADNDDVRLAQVAFEPLYDGGPLDADGYKDRLRGLVSSSTTQASIDAIYNSMVRGSGPMRPAQVSDLSGFIAASCDYGTSISWGFQNYSSVPYSNAPEGVNVYQSDGAGGWSLAANASYPSTGVSFFADQSKPLHFKVTAYNAAGESDEPPTIDPPSYKTTGSFGSIEELSMSVSSGPVNSRSSYKLAGVPLGAAVNIQVFNMLGISISTLYSGQAFNGEVSGLLLPSHLPAGSYILRAVVGGGAINRRFTVTY